MLEENKNSQNSLKDGEQKSLTSCLLGASSQVSLTITYTKTNKLISALYMVTDIMDTAEPIRNKLRTSGINIISDIHSLSKISLYNNINEVLSILDIASAVGMISEMNYSILRKEFNELKQSINEDNKQDNSNWLEGFLNSPLEEHPELAEGRGGCPPRPLSTKSTPQEGNKISIGRVGVQSGSTLLKAIENIRMSNRNISINNQIQNVQHVGNFDVLKKQRREEVLKIIKTCPQGATITDIKTLATGPILSCGEKTLQRELVSMTQDGVLNKIGEKRWSRYSLRAS